MKISSQWQRHRADTRHHAQAFLDHTDTIIEISDHSKCHRHIHNTKVKEIVTRDPFRLSLKWLYSSGCGVLIEGHDVPGDLFPGAPLAYGWPPCTILLHSPKSCA